MMVVTAKVKPLHIIAIIIAVIAVIAIILLPGGRTEPTAAIQRVETNEQRIAFLNDFGWEVEDAPVETQEVVIPTDQNEVYQRYNELQKSQGYDLDDYAGKPVKRYVYKITNHPDSAETYHATILVSSGRVVGGDVASTAADGVMHSFRVPAQTF